MPIIADLINSVLGQITTVESSHSEIDQSDLNLSILLNIYQHVPGVYITVNDTSIFVQFL